MQICVYSLRLSLICIFERFSNAKKKNVHVQYQQSTGKDDISSSQVISCLKYENGVLFSCHYKKLYVYKISHKN